MANTQGKSPGPRVSLSMPGAGKRSGCYPFKDAHLWLGPLVAALLLAPILFAQTGPRVTGVEPSSGKVNDSVTLAGQNLGKESVVAVFLSDDKTDYKATVVDQADQKIVIRIPQTKSGDYNVSIQTGNTILILPVRFKVVE